MKKDINFKGVDCSVNRLKETDQGKCIKCGTIYKYGKFPISGCCTTLEIVHGD